MPGARCFIRLAGSCGSLRGTWGGSRYTKATVGTFGELGKLLSPMDQGVFQYFNNHMISHGPVLGWFFVFIIILSSGLHLKAENCISNSSSLLSTQWRIQLSRMVIWVTSESMGQMSPSNLDH